MANTKSAELTWQGEGLAFDAVLGSGYEIVFGSPADSNQSSPMEILLAGVAGCTAMDVVHMLRKQRQPITDVAISIEGVRAEDHPSVFTDVTIHYKITGTGVTTKAVERAIALSQETYCSASIMFKRSGTNITTSYQIENQA